MPEKFMLNSILDFNSHFPGFYTSIKGFFNVINRCAFTGTVSATTPLTTQIRFVLVI